MPERNERRRQAVQCRLKGMGPKETAELCGMSRNTVNEAWQRYKAGGWKAVRVWKTGRPVGKGRILTSEQDNETQRLIRDKTPDQLKMAYALWNRQAVRELVERRYNRKLALRSFGLYPERWGFTPQKPLRKAYEQWPEAVRKWLEEDFPAIQARAKTEGAVIHWGDETGLRSDDVRRDLPGTWDQRHRVPQVPGQYPPLQYDSDVLLHWPLCLHAEVGSEAEGGTLWSECAADGKYCRIGRVVMSTCTHGT